jgi:aminopeptidase YwaD
MNLMSASQIVRGWRRVIPLVMAISVAALGATGAMLPPSAVPLLRPSQAVDETSSFSAESASAHLSILSETIGSRVAGTDAHEQAVGYVADTWRGLGYQPFITPFQFSTFEEREVSLTVPETGDRITGRFFKGGVGGEVQSEIIDAGLGRRQDLDEASLQGRIALIKRGEILFSDKLANVAAAGALGAVIDNSEPGGFVGGLSNPASIPAIAISLEDGRKLRQQLAAGPLQAHMLVDGSSVEMTASNVSASKPGTGDGIVIIGAHIDSVAAGPGANDNGSGTSVVTELGRAILARSYPFEIRLAAFGAEEIGLIGSKRYVEAMPQSERERVVAMINLDMVGVGNQLRLGGTPGLVTQAMSAAATVGESAGRMSAGLGSASDHASFIDAGMPGVFIYRSEDPNYHTANDRFEYVDPTHLGSTGRMVLALLDILASGVTT